LNLTEHGCRLLRGRTHDLHRWWPRSRAPRWLLPPVLLRTLWSLVRGGRPSRVPRDSPAGAAIDAAAASRTPGPRARTTALAPARVPS